jgi:hypothetical protein
MIFALEERQERVAVTLCPMTVYNAQPEVVGQYIDDLERVTQQIGTHPKVELIGTDPLSAFESGLCPI